MAIIRWRLFGFIVFGMIQFLAATGFSANIKLVNGSCFVHGENCASAPTAIFIDGVIEEGDAKKFAHKAYQMELGQSSFPVMLRSPGGAVYEAMEIGRLIRRLMLETMAPFPVGGRPYCPEVDTFPGRASSCVCASACFLIYAGGVPRDMAYVLLHRPYVDPLDNARLDVDTSSKVVGRMRADVDAYLRDMEIPREFVEAMFSTPSNRAVPIEHDSMRDRVAGYPSAIEEWLMAKCHISTFGQNIARVEELAAGGGSEFLEKVQRQDKARSECIDNALDLKRTLAANVWELEFFRKYSAEHPGGPPLPTPRLPPPWIITTPVDK